MKLKNDAIFKEKLTGGLKNNIRNQVNFHANSRKSEMSTLVGSFCPKHVKFQMKKYRRVMTHENEE